jgi:hypothetical protein
MGLTFYFGIFAAVFAASFTSSYVIALLNYRTMHRMIGERDRKRQELLDRMAAEAMIELSRHRGDDL